jgi:hypothetical protein
VRETKRKTPFSFHFRAKSNFGEAINMKKELSPSADSALFLFIVLPCLSLA